MLKFITTIIAALAIAMPSMALAESSDDHCKSIGSLAQTIMERRQDGAAMSDLIGLIAKIEGEDARKVIREMVIMAYEEMAWSTPEMQRRAAIEFRQRWELECYKMASS